MNGASLEHLEKARVLLVSETRSVHTGRWVEAISGLGAEVVVVSRTADPCRGGTVVQFPPAGAWWRRLPRERFGGGWQYWLAGYLCWRRLLERIKPDLVHVHYLPAEARDRYYYRRVSRLVVSSWGSDVVFEQPPSRRTRVRLESLLGQADAITATTEFLARETRKFVPPGIDIEVIPFAVDVDLFVPGDPPFSREEVVVGYAKLLEPKYGPEHLVEAFALLCERHPDRRLRLVLAGDGSQRSQLERRAQHLRVGDRVRFLGRVEPSRMPAVMRTFDIFVMPSVCQESFGVAAIEASACSIPVVASRVGGVPEAVIDGETGLLVTPGNPSAIADACTRLISAPGFADDLGERGRAFVAQNFRRETVARRMGAVYERLLAGNARLDGGLGAPIEGGAPGTSRTSP
jgi:L-malate glycosyltransferase